MDQRPTHVIHDEARWRVLAQFEIDGDPFYQLERRRGPGKPAASISARVSECEPDLHEPQRVIRDDKAVLRFNVKRGILTVAAPRSRTKYTTTLVGVLQMCIRAELARKAADRAFRRRTGKRGRK